MPLHTDQETGAPPLDRLNDPSLVARDDAEAASQPIDGLVMERVHPARVASGDVIEAAALVDVNRFAGQNRANARGVLIDVAVEGAAKRYVDHLRATADAKHGQAAGKRPLQELEFERVAVGIDP